jgi:hypothetical protein
MKVELLKLRLSGFYDEEGPAARHGMPLAQRNAAPPRSRLHRPVTSAAHITAALGCRALVYR